MEKGTPLWKALLLEHRIPLRYKYNILQKKQKFKILYSFLFLNKKIKKICIWRPLGLGDILMLSEIAESLKKRFPLSKITLLINDKKVGKEVAKRIPFFDKIKTKHYEGNEIKDFEYFKKNNTGKYDLIIHPYYEHIFYKRIKNYNSFNYYLHWSIGLKSLKNHKLEYNLEKKELDFAKEYKKKLGDYIVLVDEAGPLTTKKNWIDKYWQKLINLQNLPVILIGTSKRKLKNCIDLRYQPINYDAALIKECKLFIGLDTGPFWFTHIFNKDAVIINGGFMPPVLIKHNKSHHLFSDTGCSPCFNPTKKCLNKMRCMKIITPEIVNQKIKEVLKNDKNK